jgi:hypothetical protein
VTLATRLFLLVAGAIAPMAVAAVAAVLLLIDHQRAALERDALGRARAAMSAVDAHLRGSIAALETLAASKSLAAGDLRAFHAESQQVLRTQPAWVNIGLSSLERIPLANAVYNFGKPEPAASVDDESFDAAVTSGQSIVGSVAAGNVVQRPTVRVRTPVSVKGEMRYVISAPHNLAPLATVLEAQGLPPGWVISLVDRHKVIIARIPVIPAGVPASDNFREGTEHDPEGWFLGRTMEGRPAYTAYVTSDLSGWVLGVAIPASVVETDTRRTYMILFAGLVAAVVAGALLAWLVARSESAANAG